MSVPGGDASTQKSDDEQDQTPAERLIEGTDPDKKFDQPHGSAGER